MSMSKDPPQTAANADVVLQSYFDKWQQQEPDLALVSTFMPLASQTRQLCWFSLQHEFEQSLFGHADPSVGEVKLRWFVQDLAAADGARHPLAKALFAAAERSSAEWQTLPWAEWLHASVTLASNMDAPPDEREWRRQWQQYAGPLAAIESALLGYHLEAEWLGELLAGRRLLGDLQAGRDPHSLPLNFWLAGHGEATLLGPHSCPIWQRIQQAVARGLAPPVGSGGPIRQLQARRVRRQIGYLSRNGVLPKRPFSPWQRLWDTWQASRRASS